MASLAIVRQTGLGKTKGTSQKKHLHWHHSILPVRALGHSQWLVFKKKIITRHSPVMVAVGRLALQYGTGPDDPRKQIDLQQYKQHTFGQTGKSSEFGEHNTWWWLTYFLCTTSARTGGA